MFRRRIPFGGFSLFSAPTSFLHANKKPKTTTVMKRRTTTVNTVTYRPENFYKKLIEIDQEYEANYNKWNDDEDDDDYDIDLSMFLEYSVRIPANRTDIKIRSSLTIIGALDAVLQLPPKKAKRVVEVMDGTFINEVYKCDSDTVEPIKKLFFVIEQVTSANWLKLCLEDTTILPTVVREHSVAVHYFDTLKRLSVDWERYFFDKQFRYSRLLLVLRCDLSPETLKMVIDICRGVSDDFMKSLFEPRSRLDGSRYLYTPLSCVCESSFKSFDTLQILLDVMKELFGTTAEMLNRRVFTAKEFRAACNNSHFGTELVKMLVNASGFEQLFDKTSSTPHHDPSWNHGRADLSLVTPLQIITRECCTVQAYRHLDFDCIRSVIERCRELGGKELVQKQLETAVVENVRERLPFTFSFYPYFRTTVVQYFIEVMKDIGINFLRQQLWAVNDDRNTLFHEACGHPSSEKIEYVLNDVFKANNLTDEEILAHFQYRNREDKNALQIVCSTRTDGQLAKVKLLTTEILRLQKASETLHEKNSIATSGDNRQNHQSPRACRSTSLLKDMLEQTCPKFHYKCFSPVAKYTPLMYAVRCRNLEVMEFLLNLYRDECGDMEQHLAGVLRSCFLDRVSISIFDFIWKICLDFNDDAFLKRELDWEATGWYNRKINVVIGACFFYQGKF